MPITLDPSVHIGSGWRQPIGKLLTNRRILELQRQGFYGRRAQEIATASLVRRNKDGTASPQACACGEILGVKFYNYSYLGHAQHLCRKCLEVKRAEHDRERQLNAQWKARMEREYA